MTQTWKDKYKFCCVFELKNFWVIKNMVISETSFKCNTLDAVTNISIQKEIAIFILFFYTSQKNKNIAYSLG